MANKRTDHPPTTPATDRLGGPLAHFGTRRVVVRYLVLALGLALGGGAVMLFSGNLARALQDSAAGPLSLALGGVLVAAAVGLVLYGVFFLGESFEVRRDGVRHATWGRKTELAWD